MPSALRVVTRVQDQDDGPGTLGSGDNSKYLRWNNTTGRFEMATVSSGVTDHGLLTGLGDDDHTQYPYKTLARVTQANTAPYAFSPSSAWNRNLYAPDPAGGYFYPYTVSTGLSYGSSYLMVGATAAGQDLSTNPPSMGLWFTGNYSYGWWLVGNDSHYLTRFRNGGYLSLQSWGREIFHSDYDYHTFLDTWNSSLPALRLFNTAGTSELLTAYATDGTTKVFALEKTGKLMTNQAVSNTNTPSGATAKAMPIYDTAGTLLGYTPLYAAQW